MLSPTDFAYKHIVVITADDYKHLSLRNGNILIKNDNDEAVNQFSCAKVFCLFIIGDCTLTTKVIDELLSFKVPLVNLGYNMKYKWIIGSPLAGNTILRYKQYSMSEERMTMIARHIVTNKIQNQRAMLLNLRNKTDEQKKLVWQIDSIIAKVPTVDSSDSLRGLEWNAAKLFFQSYFAELKRYKRMPRVKCDIVNLLMDMGYTYLFYFVEANCNLYGFDSYKWVYHTLFYERRSLVCDLMEPWRCIIDQRIKNMANLGQIHEEDFTFLKGEYQLSYVKSKEYTKLLLDAIIDHKDDIFAYIKQYYRAVMKEEDTLLPTFYITA